MSISNLVSKLVGEVQPLSLNTSIESENRVILEVDPNRIIEVAEKLKKSGFDHVKSVTGTDYPQEDKMAVVYHVSSFGNHDFSRVIITLKSSIERSDPKHPSLISVWPSAEYLERETCEMLGISFEGHPKLGRLLLPEGFEGLPPLRKDFEIKTEGIEA